MIVSLILCAVIVIQSILHFIERRDMYNRLMSKDYADYNRPKTPLQPHIPSAHSQVIRRWKNKGGDK